MPMSSKEIEDLIVKAFPDAIVKIDDLRGDGDHYAAHIVTKEFIGKTVCVLIEKSSKRSSEFWSGRTSQNSVAVFPKEKYKVGDFVDVKIEEVTSATLIGTAMSHSSSI